MRVCTFDTAEDLRQASIEFRDAYNRTWRVKRCSFQRLAAVRAGQLSPADLAVHDSHKCSTSRGRCRIITRKPAVLGKSAAMQAFLRGPYAEMRVAKPAASMHHVLDQAAL